jgi:hypothetical protein
MLSETLQNRIVAPSVDKDPNCVEQEPETVPLHT